MTGFYKTRKFAYLALGKKSGFFHYFSSVLSTNTPKIFVGFSNLRYRTPITNNSAGFAELVVPPKTTGALWALLNFPSAFSNLFTIKPARTSFRAECKSILVPFGPRKDGTTVFTYLANFWRAVS